MVLYISTCFSKRVNTFVWSLFSFFSHRCSFRYIFLLKCKHFVIFGCLRENFSWSEKRESKSQWDLLWINLSLIVSKLLWECKGRKHYKMLKQVDPTEMHPSHHIIATCTNPHYFQYTWINNIFIYLCNYLFILMNEREFWFCY